MRIRKNAKISPLLFSSSNSVSSENNLLQTHLCQLNQSPWDVIVFPPAPPDSCPYPVDGEASFFGNGSLGNSIGAIESAASEDEDKYVYQEEEEDSKNEPIFCCKTVGDGNWECGREAKEGHSLCEFHLAHLENYNNSAHQDGKKSAKLAKNRPAHRAKKSKSELNPYEIYYYSGFGPRWGKKRSAEKSVGQTKVADEPEIEEPSSSNSSQISSEKFEYLDEEEEEEEEDENMDGNRVKRGRKRIKARSLKSLM